MSELMNAYYKQVFSKNRKAQVTLDKDFPIISINRQDFIMEDMPEEVANKITDDEMVHLAEQVSFWIEGNLSEAIREVGDQYVKEMNKPEVKQRRMEEEVEDFGV